MTYISAFMDEIITDVPKLQRGTITYTFYR